MSVPTREPFSEQIVLAIVARLQRLDAGATYWWKTGQVVTDASHVPDVRAFPSYGVWTQGESVESEDNDDVHEEMKIRIEVWVSDAGNRLRALRRAMADVKTAIATDERWGLEGLVLRSQAPSVSVSDPAETDAPFAHGFLDFSVFYDRRRTAA
jgi:hypothetical protein